MAKVDPAIRAHLEWIGFVQPVGLVVSAPALVRAGAILERRDIAGQARLIACTEKRTFDPKQGEVDYLPDFRAFAAQVLGWSFSPKGYAGTDDSPMPSELEVVLPEYRETLRPDLAVRELDPDEGRPPWQLLVRVLDPGADFDRVERAPGGLEASAHGRMERLLRRTGVSAGLLFNGRVLRLMSAPHHESSGWIDFGVAEMVQVAGRSIATAMRLLLSETRLLSLPRSKRFAALLEDSRKFQNEVSERLAEQVLHGLYELQRGFQSAHDASGSELLRGAMNEDPDEVYRALLTVTLRIVFLLYAEERDMLPKDEAFVRYYSLAGLYERLREDSALHPDTMGQRYGAWAQLLVLFRMVHDGAECGDMRLPRRHGVLFDPDRFPFLEGRDQGVARQPRERIEAPLVPDRTVHAVLEKLLVLDGERISYRALDVEQIGSVYETMMGFRLESATGRSIAIKAAKRYGAPTAIDLDALLVEPANKRRKWIQDRTGRKVTDRVNAAVKASEDLDALHAALDPVIDKHATPDRVPRGAMVLQPSEERRKSGSHYTPRSLTAPIVRAALEPILTRLRGDNGQPPRPEQILELKVCDPAMGSGAFLVEACRQLGDALVEAWHAHDAVPEIPADEDEWVFARRQVARRCLYGVDRNPVAVDLAKVSLWLATLAREHALTFLDHALRHGDSLVGLSRKQLEAFHWDASRPPLLKGLGLRDSLDRFAELRARIREAGEQVQDWELRELWDEADAELGRVRLTADLVVAAFFEHTKPKLRETRRAELERAVAAGRAEEFRGWLEEQTRGDRPLVPFHWEIEFPEVFARDNPGFDAFVGNPPFAGKNTLASANPKGYPLWLKQVHADSHGNADLVAHFFRRVFDLLRPGGLFGLIATNTIAQGDTRSTGLRWICTHGGEIVAARKRVKWPGRAAVVVSVVHVSNGPCDGPRLLDGRDVDTITAFLFHRGGHEDPARLAANAGKSFVGSYVLGMGFTFDDTDKKGVATPIAEMERLLAEDPHYREVVFPYLGGEEVNNAHDPDRAYHRYVINFAERSEQECRDRYPDLMAIVEEKVKPDRMTNKHATRKKYWWRFGETTPALFAAIEGLERVLVIARVSNAFAFAFLPNGWVYNEKIVVFPRAGYAPFCALQARVHEVWGRFFNSSLKDDMQYTPSDCFETFPFPPHWEQDRRFEEAGRAYYEHRASIMRQRKEGLTKTYNRFHDPDERDSDIATLRELHAAMDRAVLDAYDWKDISTEYEFLLDHEDDEQESSSRRKKPWRYRWPDAVQDEVLARLIELNAERAREELRTGAAAGARGKATKRRIRGGGKKRAKPSPTGDLF